MAAIASYHAPMGGQSVGKDPLIIRFLRGVLRLRPRALDAYVHRTALWRKSDQLLVCYGPPKKGFPAAKQTLSRWIVDAIIVAYESSDLPSPLGVKAHSTRGMAASKAFLAGVPIQDICDAAGWSTPLKPLLALLCSCRSCAFHTLSRDW